MLGGNGRLWKGRWQSFAHHIHSCIPVRWPPQPLQPRQAVWSRNPCTGALLSSAYSTICEFRFPGGPPTTYSVLVGLCPRYSTTLCRTSIFIGNGASSSNSAIRLARPCMPSESEICGKHQAVYSEVIQYFDKTSDEGAEAIRRAAATTHSVRNGC